MNNQEAFNKIWGKFIVNGTKRNSKINNLQVHNEFLFSLLSNSQVEKLKKILERYYSVLTFFELHLI